MTEANEVFIQAREDEKRLLLDQYKEECTNKLTTSNASDKVIIGKKIQQLESKIKILQEEIDDLRRPQRAENIRHREAFRDWEDDLHKINFSRVESTLKPILNNLKRQEGSALFILSKSRSMGGKWCVRKIKYRIQEDLGVLGKPCEVGFSSSQTVEPRTFLNSLAGEIGLDPQVNQANIHGYVQAIIEHILDSLISGQIFLMEVSIYTLNQRDAFLKWFVNEFWMPMVSRLPAVSSQKRRIRLMAILSVQNSIPKACLPSTICCKKKDFDGGKLLELPLQKWTENEIHDWLFDFSGLTAQSEPLTNDAIAQMAQNIHQLTHGVPNDVYHELMDAMTQCAC